MRRAVVLLSGGLDSITTLATAKAEGFEPCALSFRYGQRHEQEIEAARRVAAALGVDYRMTVTCYDPMTVVCIPLVYWVRGLAGAPYRTAPTAA